MNMLERLTDKQLTRLGNARYDAARLNRYDRAVIDRHSANAPDYQELLTLNMRRRLIIQRQQDRIEREKTRRKVLRAAHEREQLRLPLNFHKAQDAPPPVKYQTTRAAATMPAAYELLSGEEFRQAAAAIGGQCEIDASSYTAGYALKDASGAITQLYGFVGAPRRSSLVTMLYPELVSDRAIVEVR